MAALEDSKPIPINVSHADRALPALTFNFFSFHFVLSGLLFKKLLESQFVFFVFLVYFRLIHPLFIDEVLIDHCLLSVKAEELENLSLLLSRTANLASEGLQTVHHNQGDPFSFDQPSKKELLHHLKLLFELENELIVELSIDASQKVPKKGVDNIERFLVFYQSQKLLHH